MIISNFFHFIASLFKPKKRQEPVPEPSAPAPPQPAPTPPSKAEDPLPAPEPKKIRTPWMTLLRVNAGLKEVPGSQHNKIIVEMLRLAGLPNQPDETPWCAACAKWAFLRCGVRPELLKRFNAWARAWMYFGDALEEFQPGAIMVFERGDPGGTAHVTFGVREASKWDLPGYICVGGNQRNEICEQWYPKSALLAMRWPSEEMLRDMGAL